MTLWRLLVSVAEPEDLATGVADWADFTFVMVTRQDADAGGWADSSSRAATLKDNS